MAGDPSIDELRLIAEHASTRLALYRRRMYLGRGEPRRLDELQRVAEGARGRLQRAVDAAADGGQVP
jgi:hypothetical protein